MIDSCVSSDVLRRLRGLSPDVRLRVSLPAEPQLIQASESHVARAISNLVHNATEAIAGAGEVVIRVQPLQLNSPSQGVEVIEAGEYVVVTVTDSGAGIAGRDLHRIFEPFFSRKHASEYTGSGLGLAIVHGVVKERSSPSTFHAPTPQHATWQRTCHR